MLRPATLVEDLGSRLPYKVLSVLGEGSHGVVLLVEHKRLGKQFVVKLIQQRFSANRDVVGRFIAEAQRVAKLDHEAFVPIVDLGETDDGRAYFVMEYIAGNTLQQALRERGAYSVDEGVGLALQLLDGLAVAHEAHIIHRDIKPANLFVTARGKLKILDFGISKSMVDSGTGSQTAHGIAIGTPKYMSPEQAYGRPISFATDLYSVGLVLFELLTGSIVFDGADTKAVLYAQVTQPAPSMSERTGRPFSAALEAVVARALRKDPAERFQTAREMMGALRAATAVPTTPPDATVDERFRVTVRSHTGSAPPPAQVTESTRPVAPEALVIGSGSTARAAVVVQPFSMHDATARTEALPVMTPVMTPVASPVMSPAVSPTDTAGGTASTNDLPVVPSQSVPAQPANRSLLPIAAMLGGLGLVLLAVVGLLFVIRMRPEPSPKPAAVQMAAESATASAPVVTAPVVSAPVVASAADVESAAPSASPSASVSAKGLVASKPKSSNHYQAAVDAMNAGDLETADSEARLAANTGSGVSAQLLLGQILERRGKKSAARDVYKKVLETNPQMSAAVAGLKRCGG